MFYGARSLSMGNAFTAIADDLTAVFRNPAGVAELDGPQVFFSYRTDKLQYNLPSQTQTVNGSVEQYDYSFNSTLKNADFVSIAVPVMFWDVRWNFALSYYRYIPYGFEGQGLGITSLDGNFAAADTATLDVTGGSGIDVLAFSGAFYLADYLSFYSNSNSTITNSFTDKLEDQNVILGLKVKFTDRIILGISYNSKFTGAFTTQNALTAFQDETGSETTNTSSNATLEIPAQISTGLLLKPYDWMDISIDYSKRYWSRASVTNYFESTEELPFPVKDDYTFTQKDTSNFRFGAQLSIPLKHLTVFLRGGYFIDQQLFPDASNKAVKLKGFSFGVGVNFAPWVEVDIAYMKQKGAWDETGWYDTSSTIGSTMVNKIFCLSATFSFVRKPRVK
jgi:long-subunit fatty acid transport protein